jgi:hypothetical protein
VGNTDDSEKVGGAGMRTLSSYGYAPGTLMVGVADSTFPMVKADMIVSPPAIPIIPIGVGAWVLLILEQMLFPRNGVITR